MKKITAFCWVFFIVIPFTYSQSFPYYMDSPDKQIRVMLFISAAGRIAYSVHCKNTTMVNPSYMGLACSDGDFSKGLTVTGISPVTVITDKYRLLTGKRQRNRYIANRQVLHVKNAAGQPMDIIFQLSNDGAAFRYYFPGNSSIPKQVDTEYTSIRLPPTAKAWLQPMSIAKTGWQQVNPCYEEFYQQGITAGTPSPLKAGWVFPALFQCGQQWLLITEAGMDGTYCGSKLNNDSEKAAYHIAFPDPREVFTGGGYKPTGPLPFYSPWRIFTVGSLATIIESTLGTDLANPVAKGQDFSFGQPGKAAWSWPLLKDDSIIYPVQKRFIDYAADMKWQYTLIDVNWDTNIGYDSIQQLVNYARQKKVGVWLWYNSAGSWNTTPYHPKHKLLTHEDREKEFSRLQKMGVAGIKIDFFGGDGQSMIRYYIDILKDAAAHHLMVNFHGATLPRGWQRTYPNLLTTEAIRGFEYITFGQQDANEEPTHCAMLPFTRNAFDPMDFTPMCLNKIPRINRQTTPAFELALSVIFLSGVQHFAEIPEGMAQMPVYVKEFLQTLPTGWQAVKFIDGFPGQYIVLARKSGNKWYIAGINATSAERSIALDLDAFKGKKARLIANGANGAFFDQKNSPVKAGEKQIVSMGAHDGFVMVLE